MASEKIVLEIDGHIGRLTLNRPSKLNALDPEMLDALDETIRRADREPELRVLVMSGEGERAFCAGADINAWQELSATAMWHEWTRRGHALFRAIEELAAPTIAAIDGIAYGGGLELALACDLILATTSSRFAFPEAGIATIPGWGGTVRLPERIGIARSKYMMFTADPIDAATASEWGLAEEILSDRNTLDERVAALGERIAANAPISVQTTKQLLRGVGLSRVTLGAESIAGGFAASTADAREGIAAFREKRRPDFSGE